MQRPRGAKAIPWRKRAFAEDPIKRLVAVGKKKNRIGMGLMSGTSVDGVDVALAEISGRGLAIRANLLSFATFPFESYLRKRILNIFSNRTEEICEMNFILGEVFAACALKFLRREGISPQKVDFIGSHGQTVYHISGHENRQNSTLQIGEGAVIAARTGIITVCDFRPADIAAGGTGAPLVPYADFLLFRAKRKNRALLNLGGIANVTIVPEKMDDVIAFDTGPGNMVMDGLMRKQSEGRTKWDQDGRIAGTGAVDKNLLADLMAHPYLKVRPPKSTGREMFGEAFVENLWNRGRGLPFIDLMATATYFTAVSVHRSFKKFVFPRFAIDEFYVSGGGIYNRTLMAFLQKLFSPLRLQPLNQLGINGDAKEALAFALLADATIRGTAGNVPGATGAKRMAVLGKIIL